MDLQDKELQGRSGENGSGNIDNTGNRNNWTAIPAIFPRIIAIIFFVEFVVMAILWQINVRDGVWEFLFDSLLLSVLCSPFIYLFVVRVVGRKIESQERLARQAMEDRLKAEARAERLSIKAYADNVVRSMPLGIVSLTQDRQIISANPAFIELFALQGDPAGRVLFEVLTDPTLQRAIDTAMHIGTKINEGAKNGDKTEAGISVLGERVYVQVRARRIDDADGGGGETLLVFENITARKLSEQQVNFMANHDSLTGLPNRRLLTNRIEQVMAAMKRKDMLAAVMFLDLDRFKFVNDTLGHQTGDELLIEVARRIESCIRPGDTAARLGGDEFVVLLGDIERPEDTRQVVKRIFTALDNPVTIDGNDLAVSTSIGISIYPHDGETADALLMNADAAMYQAKNAGRNNCQFFAAELQATGAEWIRLENRLRKAIDREEFRLYYQPQVDLMTGRLMGAEALIRWEEPETGLISPSAFIPIAEDTGLIIKIGTWVIREACRQAKEWLDRGFNVPRVSVNVSMRQFRQDDFIKVIEVALEESGLAPQLLEIEITESMVMDNREQLLERLTRLKEIGVRLAIDDFGTGYSSLAYLTSMPVDVLKIDQHFIRDITVDENDRKLAIAIMELGKAIGLDVIAEGVETEEQLAILEEHSCHAIQGYIVTKPVPPMVMQPFLEGSWSFKGRTREPVGAGR